MLRRIALSDTRSTFLLGVPAYNSARGGEDAFSAIEDLRPATIVMESFHSENHVRPGDIIHYPHPGPIGVELVTVRDELKQCPLGAKTREMSEALSKRALTTLLLQEPNFRKAWSMEAISVLSGMRGGSSIKFGDRLHSDTFARIVANRTLDEMRHLNPPVNVCVISAMRRSPSVRGVVPGGT